uniref:PAM2 domain-containing protein n=1 Tax=Rhabditophanes sp. KR3021 TaxID=114890 RepID=A0AC35TMW0_9BILA
MSLNQEERHIMYGPPPAYPGLNPNDFILPEYEELILDETETYLKNAPVPPQYFLSQMIENDADFEKNMDAFSLKQEINGLGYVS